MPTCFFAFSALGFLFVRRISQNYISNSFHRNFQRVFFLLFATTIAIAGANADLILILAGVFSSSSVVIDMWTRRHLKKAVLQRGIRYLDEVILRVRAGRALRISVEESFERRTSDSELACLYVDYRNHFLGDQKVSEKGLSCPQNLFKELGRIAKSKASTLEQLLLYRQQIKIVETLRHKSSQAALQSRLQALIMFFIFCALSLAMISFFGFTKMQPFSVSSSIPLSLGLFVVYRMESWFRWKI